MDCIATRIPYRQTNHFTKIFLDYLDHAEALRPFYAHHPSLSGIQESIEARKQFPTNRKLLVEELTKQYAGTEAVEAVRKNIELLRSENTFTITTAHQPNIFTGPLYFIYKILHAIKLAEHCNESLPGNRFVPVFYMGSEDADLAELGHFYLHSEKLQWETKQTGAVGRMKVDKKFLELITRAEGQLTVIPFGDEIVSLVKNCYREGVQLQDATFALLHALFGEYGLIVLIPDSPSLKQAAAGIFKDDLINEIPSVIVERTAARLEASGYRVQANPREINLFYLDDGRRERIVRKNSEYRIQNTELKFSEEKMLNELENHPERFSPNVILRGIFQETILPNLVYIGGGGEIAYWLQLKELFDHYKTPFPVLVLRNSFLIVEKKWREKISRLGFQVEDFFQSEQELMNRLVARETKNEIRLNGNFSDAEKLYESLRKQVAVIDATLEKHVEALKSQSIYRLQELEKKMLRAEKRKFSDQQRQVHTIKEKLFPNNGLQERSDNFMYYYAKWGKSLLQQIYRGSLSLEEEFVVLSEK